MKVNKVDNVTNTKGVKMDKKIPTIADEVKNVVQKLFNRAEREVPQNMTFAPVKECIKDVENIFKVDEFILKIIADPVDVKNSRRVILSAFVPNTDYVASVTVTKGPKSELLKEISDESFSKKILDLLSTVEDAAIHSDIQ